MYIYICVHIFILQAAGAKKGPADPDSVSNTALRSMCESVLQLVTTTIDIMEGVSLFLYFYVLCSFSITAACIYSSYCFFICLASKGLSIKYFYIYVKSNMILPIKHGRL